MADYVKMELIGGKKLLKQFVESSDKMKKALLRGPVREAGKVLLERTKREAPILTTASANSRGVPAGSLQRSLRLRVFKKGRRQPNKVGVIIRTNETDSLFKGETFYGGPVELGHAIGKRLSKQAAAQIIKLHNIEFGDIRGRVPPNPFMKRAANEARPLVKAVFRSAFHACVQAAFSEQSGTTE